MTPTLREQLASKQRKRLIVPIQVTDASADHEQWMAVAMSLELARNRDDTGTVAILERELADASDRYRAHWVQVEMQAMSADDWESAMQQWHGGDEINWAEALAPLLAESCVDPTLRDVAEWRERLSSPEWTLGDRDALRAGLLQLNVMGASPVVPKG